MVGLTGLACRVRRFSGFLRECAFPFLALHLGVGVLAAASSSVRGSREGERGRRDSEMGKGGELWDDSALVDAFDRAVATYKVRLLVTGPDGFADRRLSAQLLLGFRVLRASRDVLEWPATL